MPTKSPYQIRNWNDYNEYLKQRGSITLWFDEEMLAPWHNVEHSGQPGRPVLYGAKSFKTLKALIGKVRKFIWHYHENNLLSILILNLMLICYKYLMGDAYLFKFDTVK